MSSSTDHLSLSKFITKVHEDLREKSKEIGPEKAWDEHCKNETVLNTYASAMKSLATIFWQQNSHNTSRIDWTHEYCVKYFTEYIFVVRKKEKMIAERLNIQIPDNMEETHPTTYRLLDVGSCYNPFRKFPYFETLAIDIAPAVEDVMKCDFLNLVVNKELRTSNANDLLELPNCSFDIVVFSLYLEYLPSPKQRLDSCSKAYELLKTEGLLVIISPDSNHVGANAKIMKSWRSCLARIGFSRIKYEKLTHLHCMAFRKSYLKEIPLRWVQIHPNLNVYDEMFIPQDFKKMNDGNLASEPYDIDLNEGLPFQGTI
ncbi:unnamed protein product [Callosobruchus maculatus]|uniref:S-adenosylmethionine sensor upstream of mTORC1 n=1 Tax=Callosobruchus maculatus TaxID=64391 RepID=A0A653DPU8_CALMS|nr:unnamed protein product [Callosobruchus maculatus]